MSSQDPPPYPGDDGGFDASTPPPGAWGGTPPPPPGSVPPGQWPERYDATEAIGWAWRAFKDQAGAWIALLLLTLVGYLVVAGIGEFLSPPDTRVLASFDIESPPDVSATETLMSTLVQIAVSTVSAIFGAATIRASLDVADGHQMQIGRSFRTPLAPVLLTGLLLGAISSISLTYLYVVPYLVVAVFGFFTLFAVVDGERSPVRALVASFKLVWSNIGGALLTALLAFLIMIAGALACLIGLLVAVPIYHLSAAYAFRRFNGLPVTNY